MPDGVYVTGDNGKPAFVLEGDNIRIGWTPTDCRVLDRTMRGTRYEGQRQAEDCNADRADDIDRGFLGRLLCTRLRQGLPRGVHRSGLATGVSSISLTTSERYFW